MTKVGKKIGSDMSLLPGIYLAIGLIFNTEINASNAMDRTARFFGLISIYFLLGWGTARAQLAVAVHGSVTDANGNGQQGIEISVTAYSATDSTVSFLTLLTGPDGMYAASLTFADPGDFGTIEVSMSDCFGLVQSQSFAYGNGNADLQADFLYCAGANIDSCAVWIAESGQPPFFVQLSAMTLPMPGITFLWNTGETSQTITPQQSGTYCVTVTFPFGCDTTACQAVTLDTLGNCYAYIGSFDNNDGTYTLEAVGFGVPPLSYVWEDGNTAAILDSVGPGLYCVTITDSEACAYSTCILVEEPVLCQAYISEDPSGSLSAYAFGQAPFLYAWNTGDTTSTIVPVFNGIYCVTITDATGCASASCYDTGGGWDSCYVYVVPYFPDSATVGLEALTSSITAPFTYLWSTGDTTSTLYPINPVDTYCVTITDGNGCASFGCYQPANYCYAWADVFYQDTNYATLTVYTDPIFNLPGNAPAYLWANGATSQSITVDTSGEYCVTVTLPAGCVIETCGYVDFESLGSQCYVWINQYPDSTGVWHADAQAWGWGAFSYLWSTGDTTSSIPLAPGEFACVTVTSTFGCATEACTDTISPCQPFISETFIEPGEVQLWAYLWSDPWQTGQYVWSTGDSSAVITVTQQGTYCVTVSAFGCVSEACIDVSFNSPDPCGAVIVAESHPAGISYTASAWGIPPFTYEWSNGETAESFVIDFGPADYCVTVTDAVGCVAADCISAADSCWVSLSFGGANGANVVYASTSDPSAWIVWSTGDTLSPYIQVASPGTYCATIVNLWGCTATTCITVDSLAPENTNVISGFVFGDTLSAIMANVFAYRLVDNTLETYELMASVPVGPQGFYAFANLPGGLYLLRAEGTPGSVTEKDYVPTYHLASATWEEAGPHFLPNFLPVTTDIQLIRTTDLSGSGIIGGALFDPEGLVAGMDPDERGAGGLGGIVILLKNTAGQPLQYVHSGDDGSFRFEHLPYGTYRLAYELTGHHSPDIWVTISPEEPFKLDVTLPVSGITAVENIDATRISVYPNPAMDELFISVPEMKNACEVRISDIQGRMVFAGRLYPQVGTLRLNVHDFGAGIYQVEVLGETVRYLGRWVKQD